MYIGNMNRMKRKERKKYKRKKYINNETNTNVARAFSSAKIQLFTVLIVFSFSIVVFRGTYLM